MILRVAGLQKIHIPWYCMEKRIPNVSDVILPILYLQYPVLKALFADWFVR